MDADRFEAWMRERTENPGTIATRVSNLKRVEDACGDLDAHFQRDRLATVLRELAYSPESEDPSGSSKIKIEGNAYNGLATLRSAVNLYRKFREARPIAAACPLPVAAEAEIDLRDVGGFRKRASGDLPVAAKAAIHAKSRDGKVPSIGIALSLSIDELNTALRRHITQRYGSVTFIEDGTVHESMFIEDDTVHESVVGPIVICKHDETGEFLAVQLLTRRATRDDAARFVEGVGREEERQGAEVRGIIAATEFDPGARHLARKVQSLELIEYTLGVAFRSVDPGGAAISPHPWFSILTRRD